ncbi:MAG: hypothetical protein WA924_06475, partial [Burkholderiaceae bacterium]
ASASAFAQQAELVAPDADFAPARTRAEVVAELNQAYHEGTLATQQRDGADTTRYAGSRSRDDVRQEALAANRSRFGKTGS